MKRMTPEQPSASQAAPFEHSVFFDRFIGVSRAGRYEPAVVAEQRGNQELIDPYQGQRDSSHEMYHFRLIDLSAKKYSCL